MSTLIAKRNLEAFWSRYKRDQAAAMSKDQWDDWVDSMPREEFMAMVSLRPSTVVANGDQP